MAVSKDPTEITIASVESILKSFVVMFEDSNRGGYGYEDPSTERSFQIRKCEHFDEHGRESIEFFLEEFVPTGRLVRCNDKGHCIDSWEEPLIREIESTVGPNGLMMTARKCGIDIEGMVKSGGGFGVGTIYHDTLESCAQAIHAALAQNVRYKYFRELTAQEKLRQQRREAADRHAYLEERKLQLEMAQSFDSGLFKGCHDGLGRPLAPDTKVLILAYINKPSRKKWLEVRSYLIAGFTTLWQAWVAIDPTAPRSGDVGYPSAAKVKRMLPRAVKAAQQEIDDRLKTSNPTGLHVIEGPRRKRSAAA